jgi:hypothetical protein
MMSDEAADADAQPEVDPALVELANATENLQTLAMQRGLLPEGQQLVSAEEFVELSRERSV